MTDLFARLDENLLPYDGEVYFFGVVFPRQQADGYFEELMKQVMWKNDEAIILGKHLITKRKVAWYADSELEYQYSGITKKALLWIPILNQLKEIVQTLTKETYNSCLLNLYHDGSEGMAWHSDGEKDLKPNGAIASLTFGAERKFAFKHKQTHQTVSIALPNGSLLVMKGTTQRHWLHRLPPTTKVHSPRINLTFRTIVR